jgi:ATP-dependent RNA helicase RhlE
MAPQALRGLAEMIVACPGRLLDHLESGTDTLASLEVLVLDEADHMFDMGFLPAVRKLVGHAPKGAQRLLFSATMPLERRRLAAAMLREPVTVEINRAETAKTVAHALYLEDPVAAAPSGDGQVARSRTSPG